MNGGKDTATPRQTVAVAVAGLLSPLIRRFPRVLAETAGRSSWLSIPMSVLLLLVMAWALRKAFRAARDLTARPMMRFLAAVYALWLLFYTGFLLRSGGERFVITVFPTAKSGLFLVCMALVCALAAAGGYKSIARSAMLLRPLLLAVPLLLFLLALRDIDFKMLLPVTKADLLPNLWAAARLANLCAAAAALAFAGETGPDRTLRLRDWAGWGAGLLAVLAMMTCACLGMFGPALTAEMAYPFFLLARDAPALGSLERAESLVVAVWVFADVVFLSALLRAASRLLRLSLFPARAEPPVWLAPACAAIAAAAGLLLPSKQESFRFLSDHLIPVTGAAMNLALPLLLLLCGLLRKRRKPA